MTNFWASVEYVSPKTFRLDRKQFFLRFLMITNNLMIMITATHEFLFVKKMLTKRYHLKVHLLVVHSGCLFFSYFFMIQCLDIDVCNQLIVWIKFFLTNVLYARFWYAYTKIVRKMIRYQNFKILLEKSGFFIVALIEEVFNLCPQAIVYYCKLFLQLFLIRIFHFW